MSVGSPFSHVHTCGACGCPSSRHERDEDREWEAAAKETT